MLARLRSAFLPSAIAFAAGALAFAAPQAMAATPPDTLVIAHNINDIITLDPAEAYEFSGVEIVTNVYDRIMRFEPEDVTKLVPGVAESWSASPDGKTFTFKIRPGLKFHSGNPVRAEDAAFSLQRTVKLDKTPAFLIEQLGWNKDNVDSMVKAVDDGTLQITITEDFAPSLVLALMSSVVGSVVDEKVVMTHVTNGDWGNGWLKANSAGSGPFVLRSWKANESVNLEAFPGYRTGAPKMKRVIVRHVPEAAAQRLLIEKGDADIARDLTPDQVAGLAGNKDVSVVNVPQAALHYLALNLKYEPFANPKVREAMRYLVDYKGMVDTFLKGQGKVHQAFWPSGFWASLDDTPYSLDPAKAKALLAEAGYPNGLEATLDAANTSPGAEIAQSVQATMAQGGIKLNIVSAEQKAVITKYRARQHQALLIYWGPDYMDPHTNADSFARNTDNSDNPKIRPLAWRNSWYIPDITKLTDEAARERDSEKRAELYEALQRKVMQEGPFIIMIQDSRQVALRSNVKNFVMGPTSDVVFYQNATK
jgi:peptide/nickel transport system substrate-binding protein